MRVNKLAAALERPRTWVIERAMAAYLDDQEWQVARIREALDDVRGGTARLIPHEQVMAKLDAMIDEAVGSRATRKQPDEDASDRVA